MQYTALSAIALENSTLAPTPFEKKERKTFKYLYNYHVPTQKEDASFYQHINRGQEQ